MAALQIFTNIARKTDKSDKLILLEKILKLLGLQERLADSKLKDQAVEFITKHINKNNMP